MQTKKVGKKQPWPYFVSFFGGQKKPIKFKLINSNQWSASRYKKSHFFKKNLPTGCKSN